MPDFSTMPQVSSFSNTHLAVAVSRVEDFMDGQLTIGEDGPCRKGRN